MKEHLIYKINKYNYIAKYRNRGWSYKRIAKKLQLSERGVSYFFRKNKKTIIDDYNLYLKIENGEIADYPKLTNKKRITYKDLSVNQKIANNLRRRLKISLNRSKTIKSNRTMDYVGCSKEELKEHFESNFKSGMTWDNYGEWEIDHIYPISRLDLTKEENIYKAMHYTNLQPMWRIENRLKGAKILTNNNPQF